MFLGVSSDLPNLHRESVYHILRKLNISYKKAKKVDPKKSEQKIEEWKKDIKKT